MAWVSSQKDFHRSELETIDIRLRVAHRSEGFDIGSAAAVPSHFLHYPTMPILA
jgi:hypothetical protein